MDERRPLVVKVVNPVLDQTPLLDAWETHLGRFDTFKTVTPLTEGADRTLLQAWTQTGLSIQHDLDDEPSAINPVLDFLQAHADLEQSRLWARVERMLEARGPIERRPAFINGPHAAITQTHQDGFDSIAFVLAGQKTFYVAPPNRVHPTRREHESSASPFTPGCPATQAAPQPFVRVIVGAGSLLYLPRNWWHFVESESQTIMLCAWQ